MRDLLIIGGGINGAGIARDAAGRGLHVTLCEKDDLASHTSSASTKLIHGGLRYLEHYEFRLVRESLKEREVLLRAAPHIIWPLRFVLPYHSGLRSSSLLRIGLFLYDHIGGRRDLPPTSRADLKSQPHFGVLNKKLNFGFEYSDCWVDDARLVALNAVDACERGAEILTRTNCTHLARKGDHWRATLQPTGGAPFVIEARAIINAAGPWVDDIIAKTQQGKPSTNVRLVKGSHIIVKRHYEGDHCYIFQNPDNRIIFAIPYEGAFTLVGTTDIPFNGDRNNVTIADDEISYLCSAANEYFETPITKNDIVSAYAGIRPLYNDKVQNDSIVTRDYVFDVAAPEGSAPMLSIFGGKITTYRKLAEHALNRLAPHIELDGAPWTKTSPLPGGEIPDGDYAAFLSNVSSKYSWLPQRTLMRLARSYGSRIALILENASSIGHLGVDFGSGLYQAEVEYLRNIEFAKTPEDILWRRTKLGLHATEATIESLALWMDQQTTSYRENSDDALSYSSAR